MSANSISCPSSPGSDFLPSLRAHNSFERELMMKEAKNAKKLAKNRNACKGTQSLVDNELGSGSFFKSDNPTEGTSQSVEEVSSDEEVYFHNLLVGSDKDRGDSNLDYGAPFMPTYIPFGQERYNKKIFKSNKKAKSKRTKGLKNQDLSNDRNSTADVKDDNEKGILVLQNEDKLLNFKNFQLTKIIWI